MHGYFGLAHRNALLTSSRTQLLSYVARLKHALLFHSKIVLADHMLVNSPNFLRAYDEWPTFREILDKEFVEVAHFERFKDGRYMSLADLRAFYQRLELFHPKLDVVHRGPDTDAKLTQIERAVGHRFPESTQRDPLFTRYCDEYLESKACRSSFGDQYGAFETAYRFLKEESPALGIIHFDPEHRTAVDRTVFDHIAELPAYRNATAAEVQRKFSPIITPVCRALLIRSETTLLASQVILPKELLEQRALFFDQDGDLESRLEEPEIEEVAIDLSAIDESTMAAVPGDLLARLRTSDEGKRFFELMQSNDSAPIDLPILREAVHDYTRRVSMDIARHSRTPSRRGPRVGILRLTRGLVRSVGRHTEALIGTVIQLGGLLFQPVIFALGPIGTTIGKNIADANKRSSAVSLPSVEAKLEMVDNQVKVTQYTA